MSVPLDEPLRRIAILDQFAATLAAAGVKCTYRRADELIDLARSNLWR